MRTATLVNPDTPTGFIRLRDMRRDVLTESGGCFLSEERSHFLSEDDSGERLLRAQHYSITPCSPVLWTRYVRSRLKQFAKR
jgi:hypothetical protein